MKECILFCSNESAISFDIETNSLDPRLGDILSIQVGTYDRQYVIKVHSFTKTQLKPLFRVLEDEDYLILGHNLKFDFQWIYHHYGVVLNNVYDTYIIEGILNKGMHNHRLNLNAVLEVYVHGVDLDKGERKTFVNRLPFEDFTEKQIEYSALDVKFLSKIYKGQIKLAREYQCEALVWLECDAVIPTAMMEYNGIYIDQKHWLSLSNVAREAADKAKEVLDEYFKDVNLGNQLSLFDYPMINYDSPAQMKRALSDLLEKDIESTGKEELMKLDHPAARALLDYREQSKLIAAFGPEYLRKYIHPITNRIHSQIDQLGADSGRFSCRRPNLMQIPHLQIYREAFCVEDPILRRMIAADYSGCELRLIAELSGEEEWIFCLKKGYDMHSYVAALLFDLDYHKITENNKIKSEFKEFRLKAKSINFGVAYGMGPGRLAISLKISFEEAAALLDKFWEKFPKIKRLLDRLVREGINNGYAQSPLDGRRRWLLDFNTRVPRERAHAGNICKNLPFQGGNASIIKRAMCLIQDKFFEHPEWEAKLLLCVHDEIIATCKKDNSETVKEVIEKCMLEAAYLFVDKVPMEVDVELGKHWIH